MQCRAEIAGCGHTRWNRSRGQITRVNSPFIDRTHNFSIPRPKATRYDPPVQQRLQAQSPNFLLR